VSTDYLAERFGSWGARKYAPNPARTSINIKHPYISHVGAAFATPVPMFIQAGSGEVLSLDIFKLYEEMRDVKGNQAELYVAEGHPHDTFYYAKTLAFEEDGVKMVRRAWEWVESVVGSQS